MHTWYVRDASGNVMGTYTSEDIVAKSTLATATLGKLYLSELHMYGSSRLGIWNRKVDMDEVPAGGGTAPLLGSFGIDTFNRGNKFFELANHLGNVLVTVSDRKVGQNPVSGVYSSYSAEVVSASDYAPFGMQMVGRTFSAGAYRYGFNGKENDNEVKGEGNQQDYGMRIYDPRLGRFLSVDPIGGEFPWNSPYSFAEADPINYVDLDGLERGAPPRPGSSGSGGRPVPHWRAQAEGVVRAARASREARERLENIRHIRLMRTDPTYANNYRTTQAINQSILRESYLQRVFNTAGSVFGGGVRDNFKAGEQWDNLVHSTMLNNPSYIGVARQVSLKVTGEINGKTVVANIRVDNVGISKDPSGKFLFNLVEAKYSINEITVNNVRQTLTPQQQKAEHILFNATSVQIFIRGASSAQQISVFTNPDANSGNGAIFRKDQNITGNISDIKIVVPQVQIPGATKPSSPGTQGSGGTDQKPN